MKSLKVYQHQRILTKEQKIADGDYNIDNELIIRINEYLIEIS